MLFPRRMNPVHPSFPRKFEPSGVEGGHRGSEFCDTGSPPEPAVECRSRGGDDEKGHARAACAPETIS